LGCTEAELSILIVDDAQMRAINSEHRGIDRATDVLSFPMREGEFGGVCPEMLGDVVISAETALAISTETGSPLDAVMELLLAHGVLHLLGCDHEAGAEEAERMKERTSEVLTALGRSPKDFEWFFDV
jgi:probable rRNA maturation factor